jgi:16S rRNA (adenine1518-N6/adenine1519-N6)-dimethyltransferase
MEPLREVIAALRAKKSLGQNFLTDPHILHRIVESASPLEKQSVIEIGPGPGGLTREIIKYPCKELILIEQDARCLPFLDPLAAHFKGTFTLLNQDALTVSLHTLGSKPRKVIANLPYNVSVPLLLHMLEHMDDFESLTLMFQKEVAARLTAAHSTPDYGRLSVMCQWRANVRKLFDLPPGAFTPAPKVTSTVVQLTPRLPREDVSWEILEKVVKAAFSQRRKMLRSSLKSLTGNPLPILKQADINPESRAETLSVQDFCRLANAYILSPMKQLLFILWLIAPLALEANPLTITCSQKAIPLQVEVAEKPRERAKGLMFRTTLPDDEGMLFRFPEGQPVAMWMKNTILSLDMIFANSKGDILAIHENAIPFSTQNIGPVANTTYVLEVKAGVLKKHGITKSCRLSLDL